MIRTFQNRYCAYGECPYEGWLKSTHSRFQIETMGEFVYAVTAAKDVILSSLLIERKQR